MVLIWILLGNLGRRLTEFADRRLDEANVRPIVDIIRDTL